MLMHAKWIAHKTGEYKDRDARYGNPSPYFRREFSLDGEVSRAELAVSALGVYKLWLNGQEVDGDYLSPGWVDYSKKLPLRRYDITHLLRADNAVGIALGDGWAVGHVGSNYTFKRCCWSDRVECALTITVEYADGRVEKIITDESWKAADGEIRRSDIYMGEVIDHRLSLGDFSTFGYDDSAWVQADVPEFKFSRNLYLQDIAIPPVVVKHILPVKQIGSYDGRLLYDVGQNIAGVLRCVVRGERGATLILRHGEMLENGRLYTKNLRKAEAADTLILSGEGEEVFRPLFTYHGFQYAEIEIVGQAEILDIQAEVMYTDLPAVGDFSCSDEIVNKIFENTLWGQRDNFMSVPTDCPQRDERLGWTGDSQIFCQTAMYNMDCRAYYEKYLADVRDAQLGNGVITAVAPLPHVGSYAYTGRDAAAGWSEAIGEIPYTHYKMYGDKKIIRDNLPALKRLLDYYEADSHHFLRDGSGGYGDWLNVGKGTDLSLIANLYYAHAADLAAKLCEIIGDDEQERYERLYENVRDAFRRAYWAEGRLTSDTQSAYAIAYKFGLIDESEARDNLARTVAEADGHLTTGFLGVKYLLPALCDLGLTELAYGIITQRSYPGWGYSILNGATTIWEHWNSWTKEKGFLPGMNSFNHYSLGACVEWLYEYCLGIRPDAAAGGLSKLTLAPHFNWSGKITHAHGHYDTAHGRIAVEWERKGDTIVYTAEVPAGIDVTFAFPGASARMREQRDETYIYEIRRA
ncbi:MAG: family 78 glycoside hydrolase catalytic domain [Clostridia bacterium]|nr:family 78 glycoside hydrolase catalytic domain [Clostridia bacterium]